MFAGKGSSARFARSQSLFCLLRIRFAAKSRPVSGPQRGPRGRWQERRRRTTRLWCDEWATVPPPEADFLYEICGDGHTGFRSKNPRVGGSRGSANFLDRVPRWESCRPDLISGAFGAGDLATRKFCVVRERCYLRPNREHGLKQTAASNPESSGLRHTSGLSSDTRAPNLNRHPRHASE